MPVVLAARAAKMTNCLLEEMGAAVWSSDTHLVAVVVVMIFVTIL